MPSTRTYYEILGVTRAATQEQIKRRYRLLVRKYHPDVAVDKEAAQAAFIEIKEAYETLCNADRRTVYDAGLDMKVFRPASRSSNSSTSHGPDFGRDVRRPNTQPPGSQYPNSAKLIKDAHLEFIQGNLDRAMSLAKEAKRIDPKNVRAYIVLGDVYRLKKRIDEAISMYTIAVQIDPSNIDVRAKLDRLLRQGSVDVKDRYAALSMGITLITLTIMAVLFIVLLASPGEPILWFRMNLPIVSRWSSMLITVLVANGVLAGIVLSINGIVKSLEDDLVFQSATYGRPSQSQPVLLLMLVLNVISFYLAVVIYFIAGLVQENISKSVVASLSATFVLVLIGSLCYPADSTKVILLGGNIIFPAVLFGWMIGDLFRPRW